MNEQQALSAMIPPGQIRPGKMGGGGVIQIHLTRACTMSCYNCTQGSNLGGKPTFMSLENFEKAVLSLEGYFGLRALFGGQPTLHPQFPEICEILARHVPVEKRGLWTNALNGHGAICRKTFLPRNCNLNVHLSQEAWDEFKRDWPESMPFGLKEDSRHSPCYVAMKDLEEFRKPCPHCNGRGSTLNIYEPDPCHACRETGYVYDEEKAWQLIANCDLNRHWSAGIAQFRGGVRGYFCEIAMAQSVLHQDEFDYPDTGLDVTKTYTWGLGHKDHVKWWQADMVTFRNQVRKHCHECSVPIRGYGELAQADGGVEQVSQTHASIYKPKRKGREVQAVTRLEQLGVGRLKKMTSYLQNAKV